MSDDVKYLKHKIELKDSLIMELSDTVVGLEHHVVELRELICEHEKTIAFLEDKIKNKES